MQDTKLYHDLLELGCNEGYLTFSRVSKITNFKYTFFLNVEDRKFAFCIKESTLRYSSFIDKNTHLEDVLYEIKTYATDISDECVELIEKIVDRLLECQDV